MFIRRALQRAGIGPHMLGPRLGDLMKRPAIIVLAMAALTAPGAMAVAQQPATPQLPTPSQPGGYIPVLPGYWEYSTKVFGIGKAQRRCLKAEEVEDFLTKPCNRHYTCVYPTKQVGNGKLLLQGYWQNKEGKRATVKATGAYQAKAFHINASGSAIGGIPFVASMDAKWLGETCPGA